MFSSPCFFSIPFCSSFLSLNWVSFCPSTLSLNSDPQFRLSLFTPFFPSTPSLNYSDPQFCPSTQSLNTVPQFCPSILSHNFVPQLYYSTFDPHLCPSMFPQFFPLTLSINYSVPLSHNSVHKFCPSILSQNSGIEQQNWGTKLRNKIVGHNWETALTDWNEEQKGMARDWDRIKHSDFTPTVLCSVAPWEPTHIFCFFGLIIIFFLCNHFG